jgi:hypothetical protein
LLVVSSAASLVQLALILSAGQIQQAQSVDFILYLGVIGFRLWGDLFVGLMLEDILGRYIDISLLIWVWFVLAVCVLALVILMAHRQRRMHQVIIPLGFMSLQVAMAFVRYIHNVWVLFYMDVGSRYFYIPAVMLIWAMIMCMDDIRTWRNIVVVAMLCAVLFSSLTSGFHSVPMIDYNWQSYSEQIGKGQKLNIPVNPEGWNLELKR